MDKYQKYILTKTYGIGSSFIFNSFSKGIYEENGDCFTITQDDDITITKYKLVLSSHVHNISAISSIEVFKNGKWENIEANWQVYIITVDFEDRIEKIKFSFTNNLADDYILNLKYVEADKEKYYAKKAQQKKDDLLKTANVKHSTGSDLVNIYFQPCCDECEKTEISLFKDGLLLAKYKVEEGVFFKSIGGLAYGNYEYIVKQFGKNDKLLLETDKIKFSISAPHFGGKPVISW
ncbi:MAG: hypothetical protein ACI4MS_04925 [Candidatus Coproplasma sp.]